jgi:hypothetical protein
VDCQAWSAELTCNSPNWGAVAALLLFAAAGARAPAAAETCAAHLMQPS